MNKTACGRTEVTVPHMLQAYRQADAKGKQAYLGLAEALGKLRDAG